jgi:hypothetical protein
MVLMSKWIGRCRKCAAEIPYDQIGDLSNPLCPECMAQAGGGNDPITLNEELAAMEARDVNEDEGDK